MILHEILPTMTSLIVATFLGAAIYAVLTAAGLQFIGLGDPNSQSWGTMLYWAENNEALSAGMPLWAIAPGVCIALLGASFALLNYAFDEISSPALRVRKLERTGLPKRVPSLSPAEPPPPSPTDERQVLKVEDLTVAYATDASPVVAVDHVDLELARGEFLAIVGESGCGKSTLLYAIARLLGSPQPGRSSAAASISAARTSSSSMTSSSCRSLAQPLCRDAERDERTQPGAHGRGPDA